MSGIFDSDLKRSKVFRVGNDSNTKVAYLNIKSLGEKINHLREIMQRVSYWISLCWRNKTRLQLPWCSVPNDYQLPSFRGDRYKYRRGKLAYIRQGLITRRPPKFETKLSEAICVELTISKKKWCTLFTYRPVQNNNLKNFFEVIKWSLSTIVNEYDNIMLIENLHLSTKSNNSSC